MQIKKSFPFLKQKHSTDWNAGLGSWNAYTKAQNSPLHVKTSALNRPVRLQDAADGVNAFYSFMPNWSTNKETATMAGQAWAYNNCPPVNSIINKKVRAFTNAKWWIVDENDDAVTAKIPQVDALKKILRRPNPLQTWNEFSAQAKVYEQTFGEVFLLPVVGVGSFRPEQSETVWVVPNWLLTEIVTGKIFNQSRSEEIITGYRISFNGYSTDIPVDQILRIRDVSVYVTERPDLILHGMSRLFPLSLPVSNIIAAYEARNVMITRKGALGILSNDGRDVGGTIPLRPDEKKDLQDDFQMYGMSREQYQVIITNASLKWQPMTFPTRDLMLFEEIMDDTRQIADCYDYPMYLLGFKEGSTFSNVMEAKKSLYQDAILPESETFSSALSTFFKLPDGIRLQATYDHLEIFQRSRKDEAIVLTAICKAFDIAYQRKIITLEEWRSKMEMDPVKFNGETFYTEPAAITPDSNPAMGTSQQNEIINAMPTVSTPTTQ